MKKYNDQELQKIIFESNENTDLSSEDSELYKMLKTGLEAELPSYLPKNFAETVTLKAVRRKRVSSFYRTVAMYAASALLLIGLSSLAFFFLAKDVFSYIIEVAVDMKFPILFGIILFCGIQLLDEMVLRKKKAEIN